MTFSRLGTRLLAAGVFLRMERVHLLGPDLRTSIRDVVRHPGGVGVLPVEGDSIHLISQFRVAVGRPLLEIPAGKLDKVGEDPEEAARRELAEEMGLGATRLIRLGAMYPSPGYTDELIHLYAADGIVPADRRPDGAEEHESEIVVLSLAEAYAQLERGDILDAKTQIALLTWRNL